MQLPAPLQTGRLIKRYKRFLADIALDDGRKVIAHCDNPGSMLGVAVEGARVWVHEHGDPKRKLGFSWVMTEIDGTLIPINTSNPNKIALEAVSQARIPELTGYADIRREVKYGTGSRIDLLLQSGPEDQQRPPCYVEIKNVHLSRLPGLAEFPDSVTARGAKHLAELEKIARQGERAVMLFIIQRSDCNRFSPAADRDPAYALALKKATKQGVETLCYDCEVSTSAVSLRGQVQIDLNA